MIIIIHEPGTHYEESFINLKAQTRKDWLCIVPVNDQTVLSHAAIGSDDGHFELAAFNTDQSFKDIVSAISQVYKADYFTFKSCDDSWSPKFLDTMIKTLESHQKLVSSVHGAICHSTLVYPDGHKTHEGFISEGLLDLTELYMEKALSSSQVLMDLEGVRNGVAEVADSHSDTGVEFWDFLLRSTKANEFVIVPQYLVTQNVAAEAEGVFNRQLVQRIHRQHALNERIRNWDYSVIFGALYTAVDRLENVLFSQSQEIQRLTAKLEETHPTIEWSDR